jgi:hypothetical protein
MMLTDRPDYGTVNHDFFGACGIEVSERYFLEHTGRECRRLLDHETLEARMQHGGKMPNFEWMPGFEDSEP